MSPQYILKQSLCRPAHCLGEYEMKHGGQERFAMSEIENLGFAPHYSEPGYDQPSKGILFANWNYFFSRIDSLLEAYGYTVEWSDEWTTCDECNGAIRTSPDSFWYEPSFAETSSGIVCNNCRAIALLKSAMYELDKAEDQSAIDLFREQIKRFERK
jgi:hypothetical protein